MGWIILLLAGLLTHNLLIDSLFQEPTVQTEELAGNIIKVSASHETKNPKFLIHVRHKALHGTWESYYPDQQICDSGSFNNNLPDGEWRSYYPDGRVRTVRNYSAEKYQYIRNELIRRNPKFFKYPIVRKAYYKEDISTYFKPDHGQMQMGTMTLLERIDFNTNPETEKYIPPFSRSLHHGIFINFDTEGKRIDSGSYTNGLKHGYWKSIIGGEIITGKYSNGSKTGQWKHFTPEGILKYTEYYSRDGKLNHAHDFDDWNK